MYTPHKTAFYFTPLLLAAVILAVLAAIAVYVLRNIASLLPAMEVVPSGVAFVASIPVIAIFAIALALFSLVLFAVSVRLKKTRLEFHDDAVLYFTGGIATDHQTTLNITNITHVTLRKPFLEHLLFNTGTIIIESAGSSGQEVYARSLEHSDDIFAHLRKLMQQNDFSLQKKELLQQEKPLLSAVLVKEIGKLALILLFVGPGVVFSLISALAGSPFLLLVLGLVKATLVTILFVRIQDLLRRQYRVYDDVIEYQEGFLTKIDSFIPAENIAECNNTQNLFDRILGSSNIIVSCQGSGDISFAHMPRGEQLEKTIDTLAKAYTPLVGRAAGTRAHIPEKTVTTTKKTAPTITGSYTMDIPRSLTAGFFMGVWLLIVVAVAFALSVFDSAMVALFGFIPLFILLFVFSLGKSVLEAVITTYEVRERGVFMSRKFLSRRTQEFTDDKLVGLEYTQSLIDKLFDTATITFYSLSSSQNISFRHIKHPQTLLSQLKEKYYLTSKPVSTHQAQFSVGAFIARHALLIPPLVIALIIGVIFAAQYMIWVLAGAFVLGVIASIGGVLRYKNSHLILGEEHVEHRVGFFVTKTTLARYEDVKDQFATHYRFTSVGHLFINVGGVSTADTRQAALSSNGLTAYYIKDPRARLDAVDAHILGATPSQTVLNTSRSSLKNSGLVWIVLLPFLPLRLWQVSRYIFIATEDRVLRERGVWNHQTQSITYSNIDHITMYYGPTNKLFGNGCVQLYTIGSSVAELVIFNVPDAVAWQNLLERTADE